MPAFFCPNPNLHFRAAHYAATQPQGYALTFDHSGVTHPANCAKSPSQPLQGQQRGDMSEDLLMLRLFHLTQQSLLVRGLCHGLDKIQEQSAGLLGYAVRSARELRWPLTIAVQRSPGPQSLAENLAVIQAGVMGNLRYQSAATFLSVPNGTPATVRQVLADLNYKACQLHLG